MATTGRPPPASRSWRRRASSSSRPPRPAVWSLPAHAALFTGTFPSVNNAHAETRYLDGRLPTIAESFSQAGYETYCFTANPHVSAAFGLTRGFRHMDEAWRAGPGARQFTFIYRWLDYVGFGAEDKGGGAVVDNISRWYEARPENDRPAFVFVNFLEAHFPFHQLPKRYVEAFQDRPSSELVYAGQLAFGTQFGRQLTDAERERIRQPLVDLYDGGVLYTDALVGQVIDLWREAGHLDETVVVVLSDHGEVVGEHGAFGHVTPMVEEDLRVPLIFRYPKRLPGGERVEVPVSTVGTYATLAELAGIKVPENVQVGSLLPALEGQVAGQPVIAERFEEHLLSSRFKEGEANGTGPLMDPRGRYRTLRKEDTKYVVHSTGPEVIYDLAADPGELRNLAPSDAELLETMRFELGTLEGAFGLGSLTGEIVASGPAPEVDDATQQMLCDLGYQECD